MIFGRKITPDNVRRVVRKITWTKDTTYDMYRHDYSNRKIKHLMEKHQDYMILIFM